MDERLIQVGPIAPLPETMSPDEAEEPLGGLLAEDSDNDAAHVTQGPQRSETVTVGDINKIVDCLQNNTVAPARLMRLVNRLVPYAKSIPGTPLAFKNERKQLYSIVASPLYEGKPWRWFVTFSNADLYEEYIYRMINSDYNGNVRITSGQVLGKEEGELYLRSLTKEQRQQMLRRHPALAARSYMIKQELIMKYIVEANGTFGKLNDHWIRVEFQRSLNAHLHMILSVYDEERIDSLVQHGQRLTEKLSALLKTKCTAQVRSLRYSI